MAKKTPKPTEFEFEILQELWKKGPQTVRQVHESMNQRRPMVYTTVLKAMQVMHEKGLVRRDDSERAHVYEPAVEEKAVTDSMLEKILDSAFDGSAAQLAMRALSMRRASEDEIKRIQELLDSMDDTPKSPKKK